MGKRVDLQSQTTFRRAKATSQASNSHFLALWGWARRGTRQLARRGAARQPHAEAHLSAPCARRAATCQAVLRQPQPQNLPPAPASRGVAALAASQLVLYPRTVPRRRLLGPRALLSERCARGPQVCTSRRLTSPQPRCGSRWGRAWSATVVAGRPARSSSSSIGALRPADRSPRRSPRCSPRRWRHVEAALTRRVRARAQAIELPARHVRAVPGPPGQRQAHLRADRRGPRVQGIQWRDSACRG